MDKSNTDNVIQLIFDKMFCRVTNNGSALQTVPFADIRAQTFENESVHKIISTLSLKPIDDIRKYLRSESFQETYVLSKLRKKIDSNVILGRLDRIEYLIAYGYVPTINSVRLALLNDQFDILNRLICLVELDRKEKSELLGIATEFAAVNVYFYLRDLDFDPNIQTLNRAVQTDKLSVIKDIATVIAPSKKTLELAFESNHTDTIMFVIEESTKENIKIESEWLAYPLMSRNTILIDQLLSNAKIKLKLDPTVYYAAILSGSESVLTFVESKMPQIHSEFILDSAKIKSGQKSLLTEEMIYEKNNRKYFSHTINYAVQSKSVEVLAYVYGLGYEITQSNVINAVAYGTPEILTFILENFHGKLPPHLILYLSPESYTKDKIQLGRILFESGFDFRTKTKMSVSDYKIQSAHLKIIRSTKRITTDLSYDADYVMSYMQLFVAPKGYGLNLRLLTVLRLCLELNLDIDFIFASTHHDVDIQLIIDVTFLFGKLFQIKKVFGVYPYVVPSPQILIEVLTYGRADKIGYIWSLGILTDDLVEILYDVNVSLNDPVLNKLSEEIVLVKKFNPKIQSIINSRDVRLIDEFLSQGNLFNKLSMDQIKDILLIDDMVLCQKIKSDDSELKNWLEENDLLEVRDMLFTPMSKKFGNQTCVEEDFHPLGQI